MSVREWCRLASRRIPCWAPIGLDGEQQLVDVRLSSRGTTYDVTGNHVIASLVPLTVAIGMPGIDRGALVFTDRIGGRELATLRLRALPNTLRSDSRLSLLVVDDAEHHCLPAGLRGWHRLRQAQWRRDPGFHMSNGAIQRLALFYLCPRPVVLVSVADGHDDNLFPMDLIGALAGGFTLALRNTSPSVATLRASGHAALADVALGRLKTAYALGKHHKLARIDWNALPFESTRTSNFGLRVPVDAPRVREYEIERWQEVGSHTFFEGRFVSDRLLGDEARLHHTCGLHRVYRERVGRPVPWREP